MKIDLSTIIGLVIGFGMVIMGMVMAAEGEMSLFIALYINQPSSAAITIGGSLGGVITAFPFSRLKRLGKLFSLATKENTLVTNYGALISKLVEFATEARRNGVLALDSKLETIEDDFLKNGLQLAIDGTAPEQIEEILGSEIDNLKNRHGINHDMILRWAELAPAFGMIGTLIGLIAMLANLSDPDAIGPSMAIALVTTFYGSVLANMICIPVAQKLQVRTDEESLYKEIILSGILSIQSGDNPRIVEQKLLTYVTKDVRSAVSDHHSPSEEQPA
jgi:chemotaxis protein MotA